MQEIKKIKGFFSMLKNLILKKDDEEDFLILEKIKKEKEEEFRLLEQIESVKEMLKFAIKEFNQQTEEGLVESSIYLVLSLEAKLNYLIKQAKRKNIKYDENILMAG